MLATLGNFIPFAFAVLDTVALLVVLVFIARGLVLAVLGRPAWKTVLIATTCYVVWANALLGFGLTGFNPGGYLILSTDLVWDVVTGRAGPSTLPSRPFRLLLVSWAGLSLAPTLALAAIQRFAERRVF
jgi:hypothetical protein